MEIIKNKDSRNEGMKVQFKDQFNFLPFVVHWAPSYISHLV